MIMEFGFIGLELNLTTGPICAVRRNKLLNDHISFKFIIAFEKGLGCITQISSYVDFKLWVIRTGSTQQNSIVNSYRSNCFNYCT